MSPELLLGIFALAWLGLLVGLWRLLGQIERVERQLAELEDRGPRRG